MRSVFCKKILNAQFKQLSFCYDIGRKITSKYVYIKKLLHIISNMRLLEEKFVTATYVAITLGFFFSQDNNNCKKAKMHCYKGNQTNKQNA